MYLPSVASSCQARHPGQDPFAGLNSAPAAGDVFLIHNPGHFAIRSDLFLVVVLTRRLGVLMSNAESDPLGLARTARARLRELEWSEGGNIASVILTPAGARL
jgi:hypothetical protein